MIHEPLKLLKKRLTEALAQLRLTHKNVQVWAEDEHRVGLQPVLRAVLAPVGQRPVVTVNPRYQWLWVMAFVEPITGRNVWFLMPYLNAKVFQIVLDAFAQELALPQDTGVVLVVDQAPWHIAKCIEAPVGFELLFLPPYSPELQPAEHLWALSDEVLFNQNFEDLDALQDAFSEQCVLLERDVERVKSMTCFDWWERAVTTLMN